MVKNMVEIFINIFHASQFLYVLGWQKASVRADENFLYKKFQ